MKPLLKIEMSRAFRNPLFLMALLLGCGVSLLHLFIHVLPAVQWNATDWAAHPQYYKEPPNSVFNTALGMEYISMPYLIYIYIIPILAALPYADSLYTDIKSGYIKNVFIRTPKHHYFAAKYIAVFLTAGAAVIIPLLLNLFLSAALLPSVIPEPYTSSFTLSGGMLGFTMYHSNPYIYVSLWYVMDFFLAGIIAVLALSLTHFLQNRFIVLLSPFIIVITLAMLGKQLNIVPLIVQYMFTPAQHMRIYEFSTILISAAMLWLPALAVYIIKGRRYETY